ncbi:MAG: 2,3-bisphosphoglycerate-independent phosphoglycerate mutase [Lentisphaeraceae bacterium]|nr:2,3-bisphosphoglycerate-independent phosphoglycerate mutase [Lentisphaeraceae bacterium]
MLLNKLTDFNRRPGPVVLCIMDGIGYSDFQDGDAFKAANTPNLDHLHKICQSQPLLAHGTSVGLPDDSDMGNSEVGHNAIGGGKIVSQGAKLVNEAIATGSMFEGDIWKKLIGNVTAKSSTLHFIGLFSDGNVHSHIDHLKAMILKAKEQGVTKIRCHTLLDGRDVGETSALDYILPFEEFLKDLNSQGMDIAIASGGGRMKLTMDRYEADWPMVERGYNCHVHGKGRQFASAEEAVNTYRSETQCIDQNMPEFVIAKNGEPVGKIQNGDSVIFHNFRGDRSIEISRVMEEENFNEFDRGNHPDIEYAGMMEYDGDLHIPDQYLVNPPLIKEPMGEFLSYNGITQLAISETQKFGHVTFFFNGNRSGKFDDKLENFVEIPSDNVSFDERPWMKAAEITDAILKTIDEGKTQFIRLNYANGDMVGHTGNFNSTRIACEVVDMQVGRLMKAVQKAGGILLITADHGNADDMYERDKKGSAVVDDKGIVKPKTSHSLNKVPFLIYDPQGTSEIVMDSVERAGLGNISSTCINLLGYEAPDGFARSLVKLK